MPLVILYEDENCLAVVDPPGQFTQGSWAPPGEITLETAIRQYLDPGDPSSVYLGIVHRLDRPTSGLLIWAKTPKAARRLSSQFEARRISQGVLGDRRIERSHEPSERCRRNVDRLAYSRRRGGGRQRGPRTYPGAREAITRVRCEASGSLSPPFMWLRLWPQTGRTHQLRAQASTRGLPIVGDFTYGANIATRRPRESPCTLARFRSTTRLPGR